MRNMNLCYSHDKLESIHRKYASQLVKVQPKPKNFLSAFFFLNLFIGGKAFFGGN